MPQYPRRRIAVSHRGAATRQTASGRSASGRSASGRSASGRSGGRPIRAGRAR